MSDSADKFLSGFLSDNVDTATSARLTKTCTASATPHSVGAVSEVDASLSADCDGIMFTLAVTTSQAATDTSTILEILTGGSGAETVWASVLVGYRNSDTYVYGAPIYVPGFIASGTRVAIRARSASASKVVTGLFNFIAATSGVNYGTPTSHGFNTGTSRGVTLTAPGSLNVKGAWTEIVASTPVAYSALSIMFQADADTVMNASGVSIDIGTGANPSEVAIITDYVTSTSASEYYATRGPQCFGVDIPAGTRIVARYARANAANPVDLAIVCAPAALSDRHQRYYHRRPVPMLRAVV